MNTEINGNEVIVLSNNAGCMELLAARHLLDKLVPVPPWNVAYHGFRHGNYWCLAAYHTGHNDPEKDGYLITMVPTAYFTIIEAERLFKELIVETNTGPELGILNFRIEPQLN